MKAREIKLEVEAAIATAKKEIIVRFRYPTWLIFWAIMPIFWFIPLVFQGYALVGSRFSNSFMQLAGNADYITFNILGSALYSYVASSLWGMGLSLRREQWQGTLEAIFISPASKFSILLGKAISDSLITSFYSIVQFVIMSLLFGVRIEVKEIITVVLIIILMVAALYGIGFIIAGIVLAYKEPGALLNFIDSLISIVCPLSYPMKALDLALGSIGTFLIYIGLLFPLTYALESIRGILMPNYKPIVSVEISTIIIFLMFILFLNIGLSLFNYIERKSKKEGTTGAY